MAIERYQALYRKFRPRVFSEVRGQEAVITTLKNQVNAGRIGHAYVFTGTRGTGKTTVAKILARAANCENLKDGDPCGECEACRRILNGANLNVVELDAASNNGVEQIREIIREVAYPPAEGKYRVYIIDEVHMLSPGAFNALLKTLEEPPEYVIFILATTEVHKIPVTVLSRCQRFDFHRITRDEIASQLKGILEEEGTEAEQRAVDYIAAMGDGSMRDALSLLERCIDYHVGKPITYEMALEVLGAVDTGVYSKMFRACVEMNVKACMTTLSEALLAGLEILRFTGDFLWYLRNIMLIKAGGDEIKDALDLSVEAMERLKEDAALVDMEQIVRYIHVFSSLSDSLKFSTQKRVLLEVALIRLCKPEMEENDSALGERIRSLERQVEKLEKNPPVQQVIRVADTGETPGDAGAPVKAERKIDISQLPKALPEAVKKLVQDWDDCISNYPMPMKQYLKSGNPGLDAGGKLTLSYKKDGVDGIFINQHKKQIEELLSGSAGGKIELSLILMDKGDNPDNHSFGINELKDMLLSAGGDIEGVEFSDEESQEDDDG